MREERQTMNQRERPKFHKNRVLMLLLALALVLTSSLFPLGSAYFKNMAYAAEKTVELSTKLDTLDNGTTNRVAFTVSVSQNARDGVSGIQMLVKFPEEFKLIKTETKNFFTNPFSFFGEEGANPLFCIFGSDGKTEEAIEVETKTGGDLVTLTFEAKQPLEPGTEYAFEICEEGLEAFTLKYDEDTEKPETDYLNIAPASENAYKAVYVPTHSGETEGVTVSGTVTSFGDENDEVTIELIKEGQTDAAYEAVIKGNNAEYNIKGVTHGEYSLKVSKRGHVARQESISVTQNITQKDIQLYLRGDVNKDGNIDATDMQRIYTHMNGTNPLPEEEYGDVNQDGSIDATDMQRIYTHMNGTNPFK